MPWEVLPGETPLDNISGLRKKGVATRGELNALEAENIRKALLKYLNKKLNRRVAPFDYAWALRLHRQMFGDVWKWAGQVRQTDLNLGAPWGQIEAQLYDLLQDLRAWQGYGMALPEQAATLHHRAVSIHPFFNGNGRWSRMLANVWLHLHGHPVVMWPEDAVGAVSPIRNEYLHAIRRADDGDIGPLLELHRRYSERSEVHSADTPPP